jgi:hypothetical protein
MAHKKKKPLRQRKELPLLKIEMSIFAPAQRLILLKIDLSILCASAKK